MSNFVLSSAKKNPNLEVVSKTIYNMKSKIYKDKLGGYSSIQALFEELGHLVSFITWYKMKMGI